MDNIKRGEIFYIGSGYQEIGSEQRAGRPAVVVSNNIANEHSRVVEIVYLTTQPKSDLPTHIDIRSSAKPSIALCEQICSVSKDRVGDYMGKCTDYEMKMIDAALLISLGIEVPPIKVIERKADEKPTAAEMQIETQHPNVPYDEYIKMQVERDTYKGLYDGLLEKVIAGRIG